MKALEHGNPRRAYNLGTGKGTSVNEVIQAACAVTGRNIRVERGPRRPGDPATLTADPTHARTELAWTPCHTAIADIIKNAWRWSMRNSRPSELPTASAF